MIGDFGDFRYRTFRSEGQAPRLTHFSLSQHFESARYGRLAAPDSIVPHAPFEETNAIPNAVDLRGVQEVSLDMETQEPIVVGAWTRGRKLGYRFAFGIIYSSS